MKIVENCIWPKKSEIEWKDREIFESKFLENLKYCYNIKINQGYSNWHDSPLRSNAISDFQIKSGGRSSTLFKLYLVIFKKKISFIYLMLDFLQVNLKSKILKIKSDWGN